MKIKSLTYSSTVTLKFAFQNLKEIVDKLRKVTSAHFKGCNLENYINGLTNDLVLKGQLLPREDYSRGEIYISPEACTINIQYDYGIDHSTGIKNLNQSCEYVKNISSCFFNPGFCEMGTIRCYEFDSQESFNKEVKGTFYAQLIEQGVESIGFRFTKKIPNEYKISVDVYNSENNRILLKDAEITKKVLFKLNTDIQLTSSPKYSESGTFLPEQIDDQFIVFDKLLNGLDFQGILIGKF